MNCGPTISIGATGRDVRRLQRIFVMTKVLAPSNITAPSTRQQNSRQDFHKGRLDGGWHRGPITWQALPADPNTPLLRRGASGGAVISLTKPVSRNMEPLRRIRSCGW
jgi:hypothetical protein